MSNQLFERLHASLRGPGAKHSRKRLNDAMRASRRRYALQAFETLEERIVMTFAAATDFPVASFNPVSVAVGDFNGDGKSDLATANRSSNNVSVLLGNGAGSFAAATNIAVGSTPYSVTVGDFNGDGKPDLATANRNSQNVSVLLNTYPALNVPPVISTNTLSITEGATVVLGSGNSTRPIRTTLRAS